MQHFLDLTLRFIFHQMNTTCESEPKRTYCPVNGSVFVERVGSEGPCCVPHGFTWLPVLRGAALPSVLRGNFQVHLFERWSLFEKETFVFFLLKKVTHPCSAHSGQCVRQGDRHPP